MNNDISWQDNAPYSPQFDDIYFNPADGLAETRHVFLAGNRLAERFATCSTFTIAELGFGTGLNCLAAWDLFRNTAPADAALHIVSFERFPLPPEAIKQALSHWPELEPLASGLFTHWKIQSEGIYRRHVGQLSMTLVIGDAREWLTQLDFKADAWFLDGFAPSKNPEMWEENLLLEIGRHTSRNGTVATFTVAGAVRRGLKAAGFAVEKTPGFGTKREMTVACMSSSSVWPEIPRSGRGMTALVIGGGIAGCSAAEALARRGIQVTLLEAGDSLASRASGNPAGALYPRLGKHWSPAMRFYWDAMHYLQSQLPQWQAEGLDFDWQPCGMLKLPIDADEAMKLTELPNGLGLTPHDMQWLDKQAASEKAGFPLESGALWLPQAAMIDGGAWCRALTQNVTIHTAQSVHALERHPSGWQVHTQYQTYEADLVVLAHAAHMLALPQAAHLPLRWDRGQLTTVESTTAPHCILSHKGYVLPLANGQLLLGATHGRGDTDCSLRADDHQENLELAQRYLPNLIPQDCTAIGGRASLRCNTPDHMPLAGELAPGLYISTAHGSRGLLSAPFVAEIIAGLACGTPPPATKATLAAISPSRYTA